MGQYEGRLKHVSAIIAEIGADTSGLFGGSDETRTRTLFSAPLSMLIAFFAMLRRTSLSAYSAKDQGDSISCFFIDTADFCGHTF